LGDALPQIAVKRASVHVESERSLSTGAAVLDLVEGVARAKDVPVRQLRDEGTTEVTVDELVEYVTATVQGRLSARVISL
jgi:hypothetical protein